MLIRCPHCDTPQFYEQFGTVSNPKMPFKRIRKKICDHCNKPYTVICKIRVYKDKELPEGLATHFKNGTGTVLLDEDSNLWQIRGIGKKWITLQHMHGGGQRKVEILATGVFYFRKHNRFVRVLTDEESKGDYNEIFARLRENDAMEKLATIQEAK